VREVALKDKDARFTALLHHVTPGLLLRSFDGLKRDAAPGADGVTWRDYERGALPRLEALRDRVRSEKYRAVPSRRVYIPKADGRLRPLGIASARGPPARAVPTATLVVRVVLSYQRLRPASIARMIALR
jgi:hypothetical protein